MVFVLLYKLLLLCCLTEAAHAQPSRSDLLSQHALHQSSLVYAASMHQLFLFGFKSWFGLTLCWFASTSFDSCTFLQSLSAQLFALDPRGTQLAADSVTCIVVQVGHGWMNGELQGLMILMIWTDWR